MQKLLQSTKLLGFTLAVVAIFTFTSCAKKMSFSSSRVVPAAEGSVKIKSDKNDNYTVEVNVKNLATPSQLTPPKNTYAVWGTNNNNEVQNIGQLRNSSGWFSKSLKGSLSTVTSFKPRSVFITAEYDSQVKYPGMIVLTTRR
ncbi:hypothetical protein SYJ56_08890 [Algoriphagus sp. D3-2-R+10]|uniref:hypothetical protein n=1 Tax=Algoriphagus aurantiacus TaxID=3103948 RepID=UPI002B3B30C8|nr:hypothetical protein [Algoriphagus sp. D3-2-R+10]MEB2775422.1 hypothetical protein [Algoriphagus sp. D3-2-R+10]